MSDSVNKAIEEIDAAFFSGDYFYDKKEIEKIKHYLERWNSGVKEAEEFLKEISE